jgi:uncharacterized protein YdhG (YjbR/CyaY superfamily)
MNKARNVEDYLAQLPDDSRTTLEKIRAAIRAAAPEAEEKVAYGMPGFYLGGHPLVYYAAFKALPPSTLIKKIVKARIKEQAARHYR